MVIITIMVAKIYFPEALERVQHHTTPHNVRSYSYRMARSQDVEEYYASDAEEEEEERNKNIEPEEILDSDDEALPEGSSNAASAFQQQQQQQTAGFLDFDSGSLSRLQVLRRLTFCCLMLNITFVAWGALQERMLTRRYPRYTGEYFTYSYALVFTNRFWTLIMSGMLMLYLRPRRSATTVIYEYSFPSISNMLSSWCQYEALRYVSFPATTLFKSFKLAPVMAMGKILGNKSYPQYDYFVALMIGIGIAMFMTSTDDLRFGYDYLGGEVGQAWTGIMLLFFYLFLDSFTSQFQSRMFATSAYSTVLSFVTLVHTKELYPAMEFVVKHQEIHLHFFLFSICSTVGQLFIFYTIRNFGAVVFTLIMTTRILLSIALSCVLYGHQVSATGFFGLMLVLAAVIYRIRRKAQGQQLLKWQGMEDDAKAHDLVQEWHEHVDM
jgi:adenosine 3'-phospho 5'-phosphosulfate transporter B2